MAREQTVQVEYKVAEGFHVSKPEGQVIRQRALMLRKRHGRIDAGLLLDDARSTRSPLHKVYARRGLWDDHRAAEIKRLEFADYLLRSQHIIITSEDLGPRELQAFPVVEDPATHQTFRLPMMEALSNEVYRQQLLERAMGEYRMTRQKYGDLQELAGLHQHVDREHRRVQRRGEQLSKRHGRNGKSQRGLSPRGKVRQAKAAELH